MAEFVGIAIESFVKEFLSTVFARTRSNAPNSGTGAGSMVSGSSAGAGGMIGGVVMTTKYRKQVEREEEAWKRGELHRHRETGLLPVEAKELAVRRPIGINDMKLALEVGKGMSAHLPMVAHRIEDAYWDGELEDWKKNRDREKAAKASGNGALQPAAPPAPTTPVVQPATLPTPTPTGTTATTAQADGATDEMDIDSGQQIQPQDDFGGWEGAGYSDRMALDGLLGDILSAK